MQDILTVAIATIGALLLTWFFIKWDGISFDDIGLAPGRRSIGRLIGGFTFGLVLAVLQAMLVLVPGHVTLSPSQSINVNAVLLHLLLYAIIACREEVSFRGYPLRRLNYVMGPWAAQLIIAVVFALEHVAGGTPWLQAFLGAGVGALFFGLAALKTKGIALPIGLHAAWNFGQWLMGSKQEAGIWKAITEKGFESSVEYTILITYLIVMGIGMWCIYYFYRNVSSSVVETN